MSKEIRQMIDKVKNFKQFVNENEVYKITKEFVNLNIIKPLIENGFNVKIVGSIAKKGFSLKDVDILLKIQSDDDFTKFEGFLKENDWEYKFSDENEDNIEWGIFHNYEKVFNGVLIGMDVFIDE
jgi:hypothetical protein